MINYSEAKKSKISTCNNNLSAGVIPKYFSLNSYVAISGVFSGGAIRSCPSSVGR